MQYTTGRNETANSFDFDKGIGIKFNTIQLHD